MELKEFMKRFASNGGEAALSNAAITMLEEECDGAFFDLKKNFERAIRNFGDRFGEKQRENCAHIYCREITGKDCLDGCTGCENIGMYIAVRNAKQPIIAEL